MLSCEQTLERLAHLTDADIDAGRDADLLQHLETCGTCVAELAVQRAVRHVLASRPEDESPQGAIERLSERNAEIDRARRRQQG